MGYHGKPSKGCERCRLRKIRCDEGKPACRRCIQANCPCPGYRDQLSVLFRDESQRVIRNGNSTREEAVGTQRAVHFAPFAGDLVNARTSSPRTEQLLVSCSLDLGPRSDPDKDEAISFFLHRFSWEASSLFFSTWNIGFSTGSKAIVDAIASVALVMLSSTRNSPSLRRSAKIEYSSAIQMTNAALSNDVEATSDLTLAAVVLLSLYETIDGVDQKTRDNWLGHVKGATALLKSRGLNPLHTTAGRQLFLEWRGQLLVGCLQRVTHVPRILTEYGRVAQSSSSPEFVYADRMATLTTMVANLRAAIRLKEMLDNDKILSAAYTLEARLEAWAATIPTSWAYRNVRLSESTSTVRTIWGELRPYRSSYQVYSDWASFHSWSFYRICRIFLNEIILDCLRPAIAERHALGDMRNRCLSIRSTMNRLAGDICSSALHVFGIIGESESEAEGRTCLGGYMLLLPLFTAGAVEGPGHPLRLYSIECFQLIAHSMGIGHALADIDILRVRPGVVDWVDELDK